MNPCESKSEMTERSPQVRSTVCYICLRCDGRGYRSGRARTPGRRYKVSVAEDLLVYCTMKHDA